MSDENVITLDSSDEETEKAPARPEIDLSKMTGITIKKTFKKKPAISSIPIHPIAPKPKYKPMTMGINPFGSMMRNKFSQVPIVNYRPILTAVSSPQLPQITTTKALNFIPIRTGVPIRSVAQNGLIFKNKPKSPRLLKNHDIPVKGLPILKNTYPSAKLSNQKNSEPIKVINTLPPGITVKRTTGEPKNIRKRSPSPAEVIVRKQAKTLEKPIMIHVEIPTVELEDDEEEYEDDPQMTEIPIEFEPVGDKKNIELGLEVPVEMEVSLKEDENLECSVKESLQVLPIEFSAAPRMLTIEIMDSPIKDKTKKVDEVEDETVNNSPDVEINKHSCEEVLEIAETKYNEAESKSNDVTKLNDFQSSVVNSQKEHAMNSVLSVDLGRQDDVHHIEEFIRKSSEKKKKNIPSNTPEAEISPLYQEFIDLCFKLDSSDDMKKIVEKKVKAYYFQVPSEFTSSKSFCKLVEEKIKDINANSESYFLYIKDIVDELKVRRIKTKKLCARSILSDIAPAAVSEAEEPVSVEDKATARHIQMLERAMKKLNKAILRLDEKEVNPDDDDNSSYIIADRYKVRLVKIHKKLCSLTGENAEVQGTALRDISRLSLCDGRLPKLAVAVRAMASKSRHWFPDYQDVFNCVKHCSEEDKLDLLPEQIEIEARSAFLEIGDMLQRRRREEEYQDLSRRLGSTQDPAEVDPVLAELLNNNRKKSAHRELEVLNSFVQKQNEIKLVSKMKNETDQHESSDHESDESDEEEESRSKVDTAEEISDVSDEEEFNSRSQDGDDSCEVLKDEEESRSLLSENSQSVNCAALGSPSLDGKINEDNGAMGDDNSYFIGAKDSDSKVIVIDGDLVLPNVQGEIVAKNNEKRSKTVFREDRFRPLPETNGDSVDSNFSLTEYSSVDSKDGAARGDDIVQESEFQMLKEMRPSSAMSGVEIIKDDSNEGVNNCFDSEISNHL